MSAGRPGRPAGQAMRSMSSRAARVSTYAWRPRGRRAPADQNPRRTFRSTKRASRRWAVRSWPWARSAASWAVTMSPVSSHSSRCRSRAGSPGQMAPAGVERSESALRPIAACARLAVALIVSLLSAMVTMSLTLSATVARHVTADPAKPPDARRARPTGDAPARHCPCEPARAARRRSAPRVSPASSVRIAIRKRGRLTRSRSVRGATKSASRRTSSGEGWSSMTVATLARMALCSSTPRPAGTGWPS